MRSHAGATSNQSQARWRVAAFSFRCPISTSGTPLCASRSSGPCARMWTTIRRMCADVARWRVSMPTTFVSGHDIHGRARDPARAKGRERPGRAIAMLGNSERSIATSKLMATPSGQHRTLATRFFGASLSRSLRRWCVLCKMKNFSDLTIEVGDLAVLTLSRRQRVH